MNNLEQASEENRTGGLNDLNNNLKESTDKASSAKTELNCTNESKLQEIDLEFNAKKTELERIEKLKKLSRSNQRKSLKSKLMNLFNVQFDVVRVKDVKYKKKITSCGSKARSNWFANLKNEFKDLFKL